MKYSILIMILFFSARSFGTELTELDMPYCGKDDSFFPNPETVEFIYTDYWGMNDTVTVSYTDDNGQQKQVKLDFPVYQDRTVIRTVDLYNHMKELAIKLKKKLRVTPCESFPDERFLSVTVSNQGY